MRGRRSTVIGAVASVVLLSAVTLGEASSKPTSTPSAAQPPPKSLVVKGSAVTGLAPGSGVQDLGVVVSNPEQSTGSVTIESVKASVKTVTPSQCRVGVDQPASEHENFDALVHSYVAPPNGPFIKLGRNASASVPLTIEMFNRDTNQDACKGARIELTYVATATNR
jgi:hypothetical protein